MVSSAPKIQKVNQSSKILDRSISIRVSKMDINHELSVSDNEGSSQVAEEAKNQRLSLFSNSNSMRSNFPDISDMYKKEKPSKFQVEVQKRKESEDFIKLGQSIDHSKHNLTEYNPSKFQPSPKHQIASERFKRDVDVESIASSRKPNDFSSFQQALVKHQNDDHDPEMKRISLLEVATPGHHKPRTSFSNEVRKHVNKVDTAQVLSRVRRAIRVKLLNNIKFFNILSKTYQIDERSMKQRYYYLYNDPSVDLEDLKRLIRDAKEKKEKDLKEILRKLDRKKVNENETLRKIFYCCYKNTAHDEPDYSYKDKIDIPMKFEPKDTFVFNLYSPYLMMWNAMLFIILLTQLFVKV